MISFRIFIFICMLNLPPASLDAPLQRRLSQTLKASDNTLNSSKKSRKKEKSSKFLLNESLSLDEDDHDLDTAKVEYYKISDKLLIYLLSLFFAIYI